MILLLVFVVPWIGWTMVRSPQEEEYKNYYLYMRKMQKEYQGALEQIIDTGKIAKIMNNIDAWLQSGVIINEKTREVWSFEAKGNWKKTEFGWRKVYKAHNGNLTVMNLYHDGRYGLNFKGKILVSGDWLEEFKRPFDLDPGRHPWWVPY